ncbi:hypothetical protein L4C38_04130 [Vibrio kasasachensis]
MSIQRLAGDIEESKTNKKYIMIGFCKTLNEVNRQYFTCWLDNGHKHVGLSNTSTLSCIAYHHTSG